MRGIYLDTDEVNNVIKEILLAIPLESLETYKQDYKDGVCINELIRNILDADKHYSSSIVRYEVSNDIYEYQGHGEYIFKETDYSMETKSLYDYIIENNKKEYFIEILKDRFREIA